MKQILCAFVAAALGAACGTEINTAAFTVVDEAAFRELLPADGEITRLATGMTFTEGPVWINEDGGYLVFSNLRGNNELRRWDMANGLQVFRKPSGNSNGNTLDLEGRLVTAEHDGRITRTESDGTIVTVVDSVDGAALSSPNDVVFKSDGTMWFTDPPYGLGDRTQETPGNYVYRFDPVTAAATAVATNMDRPNGLCFSPDESVLYVADSGEATHHIRAFTVNNDGATLSGGDIFATIDAGGPDGIRCDELGNVWSASGDGVQIFAPSGSLIARILLPESGSNLTFGGADGRTVFITARTSLYSVQALVRDAAGRATAETDGGIRSPNADGMTEWRHYGGNLAAHRYSPLDQIDASNVGDLRIAWRWYAGNFGPRPEARNQSTPLLIDGVLYMTAGITRNVAAIDPETGETLWVWRSQEEPERFERAPRKSSGRGLSYWTDAAGNDRLFVVTPGFQLVALDPDTGRPIPGFGENGVVDMLTGVRGGYTDHATIGNTAPALIIGDTIIVGPAHATGSRPPSKQNVKGDVRAYDVRTGQELWSFHTIPTPGEAGYETWLEGSAEFTGNTGVWTRMSADVDRGLVYLPVEAPTSDWWGGERPGNNLYGNSLVCIDARSGEIVWYFQLVHHDIWDYDNPTAPILMDIIVDGVEIPAVAQITKQSWVYTFNRITGEPVWPIEERPVPPGDVPGEWYAPTQPYVTKPAPFDRQGFVEDDIIDFTPELRAEALEGLQQLRMGPLFTAPSLANHEDGTSGIISLPHQTGGANWEAATYDAETGMLYIGSATKPTVLALVPPDDGSDITYVRGGEAEIPWLSGLPVVKPPWGRISAINMHTGELAWMRANGPTPENVLNNPALQGVDIPETGRATRAMLLATKTLLFGTDGIGGTPFLRVYDKATGAIIAEIELPGPSSGLPMSYAMNGKQFIALAVTGDRGAELVALALPD